MSPVVTENTRATRCVIALFPRVLARVVRFLRRQSAYEQHASVPVLISHSGLHIPGRSLARSTVAYMQQGVGACRPSSPKSPEPEPRTNRNAAAMPRPVSHPLCYCVISAGPGSDVCKFTENNTYNISKKGEKAVAFSPFLQFVHILFKRMLHNKIVGQSPFLRALQLIVTKIL